MILTKKDNVASLSVPEHNPIARGTNWKVLINEALRLGLTQLQSKVSHSDAPATEPKNLGRCLLGQVVSVSVALAL